MKSKLNFIIEYDNGEIVDIHSDLGLWVDSFHIHSPDIERKTITAPNRNGTYLSSSRIKTRKIDISFHVESDSLFEFEDLKHKIYSTFYSENEFKIIRDILPNMELYAAHEGEYDIDNITQSDGEFSIELTMYDPYIYGETVTEIIDASNTIVNLFANQEVEGILHGSLVDAIPIFTVTFSNSASYFKINHQESGKFVKVNYNFVANDVLEIDLTKRKVSINGNVQMTAYGLDSSPFKLKKGENNFTIEPQEVATTEIKFRERWF